MALIEMLEAPIPLIVGNTSMEYESILTDDLLEPHEMQTKIWVHLKLIQNGPEQFHPLRIEHLDSQLGPSICNPESCKF